MILSGDHMEAIVAEKAGLVAKVFPPDKVVNEAVDLARRIGMLSSPVIAMAKEAVNQAEEMTLKNGLQFERRLYHASFGLDDSKEGMGAFLQKRTAQWGDE